MCFFTSIITHTAQAQINTTLTRQSETNPAIYEDILSRILKPELHDSIFPVLQESTITSTYIKIPLSTTATVSREALVNLIVSDEIQTIHNDMLDDSIRLQSIPFTLKLSTETTQREFQAINNAEIARMFVITDTLQRPGREIDLSSQTHWDGVRQAGCWAYEHSCAKVPPEYRDHNVFAGDDTPYSFLSILSSLQVTTRNIKDSYLASNPLIKLMSESLLIPYFGLVERYGENVRSVIIESAGNDNGDGPFESGSYAGIPLRPDTFSRENERGQPTLYYRNAQGDEIRYRFIIQDAFRNIRSAILANKVVYVAGYFVVDEENLHIPLSTLMQHPISEHQRLGTIVRSRSTRCKLIEEACFYMPYGYLISRPLSVSNPSLRFERDTYGTSFSSPAFAGILASALALAPHKSGSEIVQLAKDCAQPIDGLDGLGIPDYLCMKKRIEEDDTLQAELFINVEPLQVNIKIGYRQRQASTLTTITLTRIPTSSVAIEQFTVNGASLQYPLPNQRLNIATDMASITLGIEPVNSYAHVIKVTNESDPAIEERKNAIRNQLIQPPGQAITEFNLALMTNDVTFTFAVIAEDGTESEVHNLSIQKRTNQSLTIEDTDDSKNSIAENSPHGTLLSGITLVARNENDQILSAFWRLADSTGGVFTIDPTSGVLSVSPDDPANIKLPIFSNNASLDYELQRQYRIEVEAVAIQNDIVYLSQTTLSISVENVLEYINDIDSLPNQIAENAVSGTVVSGIALQAHDEDHQPLIVQWGLTDSADGVFAINAISGAVALSSNGISLDYETQNQYRIEVQAVGIQRGVIYLDRISLTIDVENVFESVAITDTNPALNHIAENAVSGTVVSGIALQAHDEGDQLLTVQWSLINSADSLFTIGTTSGAISLSSNGISLDYEMQNQYHIEVQANIVQNSIDYSEQAVLLIDVENVFESVAITDTNPALNHIAENAVSGTAVSGIALQARDEGNQPLTVQWSLTDSAGGIFTIGTTNGAVALSENDASIDYEMQNQYRIEVQANIVQNSIIYSDQTVLVIDVENVLESVAITDTNPALNHITENADGGTVVSGIALQAYDEGDQLLAVQWSLINSGDGTFTIGITSGAISLSSTNDASIDYEIQNQYRIEVQANTVQNSIDYSDQTMLVIDVENVLESVAITDTNPALNQIAENAVGGTAVSGIALQARDEGDRPLAVQWSLINSAGGIFAIDITSGAISLSSTNDASIDYEMQNQYRIEVQANIVQNGIDYSDQTVLLIDVENIFGSIAITDTNPALNQIAENADGGTVVSGIALQAYDEGDQPLTVQWSLINSAEGAFAIDTTSGAISLSSTNDTSIDYEMQNQYHIEVQADIVQNGTDYSDQAVLLIDIENILELIAITDINPALNQIAENAVSGTVVSGIALQAHDEGNRPLAVRWSLINSGGGAFAIDTTSGAISLSENDTSIDYETQNQYRIEVQANIVQNDIDYSDQMVLLIDVENILESVAITDTNPALNHIAENAVSGTVVSGIALQARDESDQSLTVQWSLTDSAGGIFTIGTTSSVVTLSSTNDASIDYEIQNQYRIEAQAIGIQRGIIYLDRISLTIDVENVFESVAITDTNPALNRIAENAVSGTAVSSIALQARDEGNQLLTVQWRLTDSAGGIFAIGTTSGAVSLSSTNGASIDYEIQNQYRIEVQANTVQNGIDYSDQMVLVIDVENVFESVAITDTNPALNQIAENAIGGTAVSGIALQARDEGDQLLTVQWRLTDSADGVFAINAISGAVALSSNGISIDYEIQNQYRIEVQANIVQNGIVYSDQMVLVIDVENVLESVAITDTNPALNRIAENAVNGTAVSGLALQAHDEGDQLLAVQWSLTDSAGGIFTIDITSGAISLSSTSDTSIDYEIQNQYRIEVQANTVQNSIVYSNQTILVIDVENVLESVAITDTNPALNRIAENAVSGTAVSGIALQAYDEGDQSLTVQWSLINSGDGAFTIGTTSGAISLSSTNDASIDYEIQNQYRIEVQANTVQNSIVYSDQMVLLIDVENVFESVAITDTNPALNRIAENAVSGTVVSGIALQARDEGNQPLTVQWSLINSGNGAFTIGTTSGAISLSENDASIDYEIQNQYLIEVQADTVQNSIVYSDQMVLVIDVENVFESVAITDTNPALNQIAENAVSGTVVSGIALQAHDENDQPLIVQWGLTDSADGVFAINAISGAVALSSNEISLDYETQNQYRIEAQAIGIQRGIIYLDRISLTIDVENVFESVAITDTNPALNHIAENAVSGTVVSGIALQAHDEGDRTLTVQWSLTDSADGIFTIDITSGAISLSSTSDTSIDYEIQNQYRIEVQANTVQNSIVYSDQMVLVIDVENVFESVAITDTNPALNRIAENAVDGTEVSGIALQARDEGDQLLTVQWRLTDSAGGIFAIGTTSGAISLSENDASIDYEIQNQYRIEVQANIVQNDIDYSDQMVLVIDVENVFESVAITDTNPALNQIAENAVSGTAVSGIALQAHDENDQPLIVQWGLTDSADGIFTIGTTSGAVALSSTNDTSIDYEIQNQYRIEVQANIVQNGIDYSDQMILLIDVENVFESVAITDTNPALNRIAENAVSGTAVSGIALQAYDEGDQPLTVQWSLTDSAGGIFTIGTTSSVVTLSSTNNTSIDYEIQNQYRIEVQANTVQNGIDYSEQAVLLIDVENVFESVAITDTNPALNQIVENAVNGTAVSGLALQAYDEGDQSLTVQWSLTDSAGGIFTIGTTSGAISLSSTNDASIDYETQNQYRIEVQANIVQNSIDYSDQTVLVIDVENVLESVAITDTNPALNQIAENAVGATTVSGIALQARDEGDQLLTVQWKLTDSAGGIFTIGTTSGAISLSSTNDASIDYETQNQYRIEVQADIVQNGTDYSDQAVLLIDVENVFESVAITDTNPALNQIAENADGGTVVSGIALQARDEGDRPLAVQWSLINSAEGTFTIDTTSGAISLSSTNDTSIDYEMQNQYRIEVQANIVQNGIDYSDQTVLLIDVENIFGSVAITDTNPALNRIAENAVSGTVVSGIALQAYDEGDQLLTVQWSLINSAEGTFTIDTTSGTISLSSTNDASIDYEIQNQYRIEVQANTVQNDIDYSDQAVLLIDVENILELIAITDSNPALNHITKNTVGDTVVSGIALQARDEGNRPLMVRWGLIESSGGIFVINTTSSVITLSSTANISNMNVSRYQITAFATANSNNGNGQISSNHLLLDILVESSIQLRLRLFLEGPLQE